MTERDRAMKVVFLTAFEVSQSEFGRLFPGAKVRDTLRKPVSIDALANRLDAVDM